MNIRRHGSVLIATDISSPNERTQLEEWGFEYSKQRRATCRPWDDYIVREIRKSNLCVIDKDVHTLADLDGEQWRVCKPLKLKSKRESMEHQLIGNRLLLERKRYMLAWEMGTGKTKPCVDAATHLITKGVCTHAFVFAPSSVVGTWVEDAIPSDSDLKAAAMMGTAADRRALLKQGMKRNTSFFVFNYPATRVHNFWQLVMEVASKQIILILDESTAVKNHTTQQFERIYELIKEYKLPYVWLLSGTPVTQSPEDIFGQAACIDTRLFGAPYQFRNFRARYVIQSSHNKHVVIGYRNLDKLALKIKAISHRVKSMDVLDLPPKVYQTVALDLPPKLKRVYDDFVDSLGLLEVGGKTILEAENPLTVMSKARQIVHNWVYKEVDTVVDEELVTKRQAVTLFEKLESPKLDWIVDAMRTGVPTLIWYAFHGDKFVIQERLIKEGITFVTLDTSVHMSARQDVINEFMRGKVQGFLSNPNLGGEGINLQRARLVVYFNNVHSVKARMQSEARAWRKGTTHKVHNVDLVYRGTVDVTIKKTIDAKRKLSSMLTDVDPQTLSEMLQGEVYI